MNKNIKIAILAALPVLGLFFYYIFFLNHVNINEVGVAYNSRTGEIKVQSQPGWYVTSPMVKVVCLSTLPQQVHLPTQANVIATKIVRLRSEKVEDFIKLQGFNYNVSGSFNSILMGYAFCGQKYDFLEVVQDSTPATLAQP